MERIMEKVRMSGSISGRKNKIGAQFITMHHTRACLNENAQSLFPSSFSLDLVENTEHHQHLF